MKSALTTVPTLVGLGLCYAGCAFAQDIRPRGETEVFDPREFEEESLTSNGFHWEIEIEIGTEQTFESDDPDDETHLAYADISAGAAYVFANGFEIFTVLSFESMAEPSSNVAFDYADAFVEELGVSFNVSGSTVVSLGKVQPVFGSAWDDTSGFYGAALSEDYELEEQISLLAEVELGDVDVLSFGTFFADDTVLSQSFGHNRSRNTVADGGAGNTGNFNNAAIQWSHTEDDTFFHIGARHLSAGEGDRYDENGIVAGFGHAFENNIDVFAEMAAFNHFEGGSNNAAYVTLNATYPIGNISYSGTLARRDIENEGNTDLVSVAAEYEFPNGVVLGGAVALINDAGSEEQQLGLNIIIPLGN